MGGDIRDGRGRGALKITRGATGGDDERGEVTLGASRGDLDLIAISGVIRGEVIAVSAEGNIEALLRTSGGEFVAEGALMEGGAVTREGALAQDVAGAAILAWVGITWVDVDLALVA